MFVIQKRFIFFVISGLLVLASLITLFTKGFNTGIEFTGGSVLELSYPEAPNIDIIKGVYEDLGYSGKVQPFGENGVVVRTRDLAEPERQELVRALTLDEENTPEIERFNSIGPSIGKELRRKAWIAIILVALGIVLFVAYAFRGVSGDRSNDKDKEKAKTKRTSPSAWTYGLIAVVALLHDVLIPAGIFALVGKEVDSLFIVGILSILGLSVNDTIVVFDRIRENVQENQAKTHNPKKSFNEIVGKSLWETVSRSIFTSLTLLVVLVALYVVGPLATRDLAFIMILGTLVGTYSSIFLASPLLVTFFERMQAKVASGSVQNNKKK